MSILRRAPR